VGFYSIPGSGINKKYRGDMQEVTHDYRDKSTKLVVVADLLSVYVLEIYCFQG
jgi:hypothetical protein